MYGFISERFDAVCNSILFLDSVYHTPVLHFWFRFLVAIRDHDCYV